MLYPAQCKQIRTHWLHRDYIHDMVHGKVQLGFIVRLPFHWTFICRNLSEK